MLVVVVVVDFGGFDAFGECLNFERKNSGNVCLNADFEQGIVCFALLIDVGEPGVVAVAAFEDAVDYLALERDLI